MELQRQIGYQAMVNDKARRLRWAMDDMRAAAARYGEEFIDLIHAYGELAVMDETHPQLDKARDLVEALDAEFRRMIERLEQELVRLEENNEVVRATRANADPAGAHAGSGS